MIKNHKLAKSLVDVSFYEFNRQLEYKANYMQKEIHRVDKFYPSSKTCCVCGNIKQDLTLKDRIYKCKSCLILIKKNETYKNLIQLMKIIDNKYIFYLNDHLNEK
ncbi:TPA: transposase, partial [Campylobacter fetus subsp. venerealis]|nr:transposase [Campylobacter fetus subsp. venerealis]